MWLSFARIAAVFKAFMQQVTPLPATWAANLVLAITYCAAFRFSHRIQAGFSGLTVALADRFWSIAVRPIMPYYHQMNHLFLTALNVAFNQH
jgi:hypothetical protein